MKQDLEKHRNKLHLMHLANVLPLHPSLPHLDAFAASTISGKWSTPYFFDNVTGLRLNRSPLFVWNEVIIDTHIIITGHTVNLLTTLCLSNHLLNHQQHNSKYCSIFSSGFPETWWSDLHSIQLFVAPRLIKCNSLWMVHFLVQLGIDQMVTQNNTTHVFVVFSYNCWFRCNSMTLLFCSPSHVTVLGLYPMDSEGHQDCLIIHSHSNLR